MFPPKKKPGLDVMIAVGKPKHGGPPDLKGPDEPDDMPDHAEPDADDMGGESDGDQDNMGGGHEIMQYAHEIAAAPGGADVLKALCHFVRGDQGGGEDAGY